MKLSIQQILKYMNEMSTTDFVSINLKTSVKWTNFWKSMNYPKGLNFTTRAHGYIRFFQFLL